MVEQKKFDFIDALRGVAVLLVITAHTPLPPRISVLNVVGSYGVQLFFIVSAFTLFLSLEAKSGREVRPFLFFFIRRFFRIAPAFYLAAAFYLLKGGLGPTPWAPTGIHAWQIISTLLFVNGWHPQSINAVVPGGWSIAVEMNFYLVVPFCFVLITNAYRAFFTAAGLVVAGVVLNRLMLPSLLSGYAGQTTIVGWFPQLWFPAQAGVFSIGFLLFFLFKDRVGTASMGKGAAAGLLGLTAYLLLVCATTQFVLIPGHFVAAVALGIACYALSAQSLSAIVNPLVCYVGKISFSVYLFHFWAIDIVQDHIAFLWAPANAYAGAAMFFASTALITCLIASVTYRLIEQPGQRVARLIIARIEGQPALQSEASP
jgi:peptidoglycan/LPS O-acetylase OafA/YrhL